MLTDFLVLDIATAPIVDAGGFLEEPSAPANYKDPQKIADYIAEKKRDMGDRAALDPDLLRISAIGHWQSSAPEPCSMVCREEDGERTGLKTIAAILQMGYPLITFNGFRFDLPALMRRARYLGVAFPAINLDRYRTPHFDLCEVLTNRGSLPSHSLGFYAKRLGWTDLVKPLSGAEEARVFETGQWDELQAASFHDVTATYRLAQWLGVIAPERQRVPQPVF